MHGKDLPQHRALPPCYRIHIPRRLTVLEFLDRYHRGLHRVALLDHLGSDSVHEVEKIAKLRREGELHLLLLLNHLLHVAHLLLLLLDRLAQVLHRGRVMRFRVGHLYPVDKTVEITAKGLEVLRLPPGDKVEVKKLISTEELLSGVDVYIAPQVGIFNIKRAFREGGEGLEAVITELGDDVSQVIPRLEMDTEATGLIKLTLRIKLTAEKAVEKKLQALCKDSRNELAEIRGVPTKLASGDEVRMIWSGDLGTARVRNGLNRVAAIAAEQGIKSSEEVKKLKGELEKQIKVNVDAILEQEAKITAYSSHMQGLMDKQATVITEMQSQHASATEDLHKQMAESETAHAKHDPPIVALPPLDSERHERRLELLLELVEMLAHGFQLLGVGRVINVRGVPVRVGDNPLLELESLDERGDHVRERPRCEAEGHGVRAVLDPVLVTVHAALKAHLELASSAGVEQLVHVFHPS